MAIEFVKEPLINDKELLTMVVKRSGYNIQYVKSSLSFYKELAIEAAKTAQADVYVPEAFAALQDSMNVAVTSIEAKKSKLFKK